MPEARKQPSPANRRRPPREEPLRVSLTLGTGLHETLLGPSARQSGARRRIRSRRHLLTATCAVLLAGVLLALLRELFF